MLRAPVSSTYPTVRPIFLDQDTRGVLNGVRWERGVRPFRRRRHYVVQLCR